jgi:molybdenum cofactor guanylyltransferase
MKTMPLWGLVLAGGRSRRMGRDKALIEGRGQPQAEAVFDLLGEVCARVFASTREDQDKAPGLAGLPKICDLFGHIGPIDGILSALQTHPDKAWLVAACDLPFLDRSTLDFLVARRNPARIATAFLSSHDGLPEPLCAIYEPAALDVLRGFVARGVHCPRKALINSDFEKLTLPNPRALENVNTPDELAAAMRKTVKVQYFAALRELRGSSSETVDTHASTPSDLYDQLDLSIPQKTLRVAVNNEFVAWDRPLRNGDLVAFIPPTAGG